VEVAREKVMEKFVKVLIMIESKLKVVQEPGVKSYGRWAGRAKFRRGGGTWKYIGQSRRNRVRQISNP
jgi:hypothetical protein